ncbi:hypothetical protein C8R44DRAFT_387312 [Mycena epipterygia]|nr:hypothetical protein C8R44DRAFT_387312 [Mycena epipterygia]
MRISATCFDGDLFSKHQRCFSRPSTVRVTDGLTRCFLPAAPSYWRRVPMNHPYSGAASYIYANEHSYSPVDPKPKDPYSNLPSFVPVSSQYALCTSDSPTTHPEPLLNHVQPNPQPTQIARHSVVDGGHLHAHAAPTPRRQPRPVHAPARALPAPTAHSPPRARIAPTPAAEELVG